MTTTGTRWRLYAQDFATHRYGDKKPHVEMQTFDTKEQAHEKAAWLRNEFGADYLITIAPEPTPKAKRSTFNADNLPKYKGGMRLTK